MRVRIIFAICLILFAVGVGYALESDQILVITNSDVAASVQIARYYCAKRGVPVGNVLALPLGTSLNETIDRNDYEKQLAEPIRKKISSPEFAGKIKCLLTTYGVPIKVGERGLLKGQEDALMRFRQLKGLAEEEKTRIEQLEQNADASSKRGLAERAKRVNRRIARLQSEIDRIIGKETNASVDSELSMALFDGYELHRWRLNKLKKSGLFFSFGTLMVCRLDGPGLQTAKGLVDKAVSAERNGLKGVAYIDSGHSVGKSEKSIYHKYDQSLRDLAAMIRLRTEIPVEHEQTERLFEPGACPRTAIYCGWYSLEKYIDAFDFVDGAIGYHISSLEAVDLRDPNSSQWCASMLVDGITATLGAVAEPYLHSFPEPEAFFRELLDGHCLVEAYYHTKPFNSWQLVLVGDPLYRPFKKTFEKD